MCGIFRINRIVSFLLLVTGVVFQACNKDDVLEAGGNLPVITLDDEYGVYTVKVGRTITISPEFTDCSEGDIVWTSDGDIVARGPVFTGKWDLTGEHYLTVTASNAYGKTSEDLRVDVLELTPPVISLQLPPDGLRLLTGADYTFTPDIQHSDDEDFAVAWYVGGDKVGSDISYTFNSSTPGTFTLAVEAVNSDGSARREFNVEVVESMPHSLRFLPVSYTYSSTDVYTFPGRPVCLTPLVLDFEDPVYKWSVDGEDIVGADPYFSFTPSAPGTYRVRVSVSERDAAPAVTVRLSRNVSRTASTSAEGEVKVICVDASEKSRRRPATAASDAACDKVYEWIPAPGQFINLSAMKGAENSKETAFAWAQERLGRAEDVSLGAFGGYIVVGFDHSVAASASEYDFVVFGNSFDLNGHIQCSNEPGIVWVMQDVNGNGLPDDVWYELKASEYDRPTSKRNYGVTYYRPSAPAQDVVWVDMEGTRGKIDYVKAYHSQPYYYPLWIDADSYTLYGSFIADRCYFDPETNLWQSPPYDWGYADNVGSDTPQGIEGQCTGFRIANAVMADGTPVSLEYIDFVKIQAAVQSKMGTLGEMSTEVLGVKDYTILKR